MPEICRFFGIIIRMFFDEHDPPHFHAEYQGQRSLFDFDGNMLKGNMKSNTAKKLIQEWALLHREELKGNWDKAVQASRLTE